MTREYVRDISSVVHELFGMFMIIENLSQRERHNNLGISKSSVSTLLIQAVRDIVTRVTNASRERERGERERGRGLT